MNFRNFFWFLVVVGVGVGAFFAIRFFFFNPAGADSSFKIVNELVSAENYEALETELDGSNADGIFKKVKDFLNSYTSNDAKDAFANVAGGSDLNNELSYTKERLDRAMSLYDDYLIALEFYHSHILFLNDTSNLGSLVGDLDKQRKEVNIAINDLLSYIQDTLKPFTDALIVPNYNASVSHAASYIKSYNESFLRGYVSKTISFVEQATKFCAIMQDIIINGSGTLATNPYKMAIKGVQINFAMVNIGYLKAAPDNFARNAELPSTDANKFDADKTASFTAYSNLKNKFSTFPADDKVIVNYEKEFIINYNYGSQSETFKSSYEEEVSLINLVNLTAFLKNYVSIQKDINEHGPSTSTPEEGTTVYVSPYLASLSITEATSVKNLFVRLAGQVVA